jgi:hypothetical protein
MANVKTYLKEMNDVTSYILFRHVEGFGFELTPPAPDPTFFTGPYERVGRDAFYINKA